MCDHKELSLTITGYGSSRSEHYECARCGEDDYAELLEAPTETTLNPSTLKGWEEEQDPAKVASLRDAYESGEDVPPVIVGAGSSALYDGHHRAKAAAEAGVGVPAVLIPKSWGRVSSTLPELHAALKAHDIEL